MRSQKSNKTRNANPKSELYNTVYSVRAFNRYYTGIIGVLNKQFLNSSYSLPEARILYEINFAGRCTSKEIIERMNIDGGYLCRILNSFTAKKLIKKTPGKDDGRVIYISLTAAGKALYNRLTDAQNRRVYELVSGLRVNEQKKLVSHMEGIKKILWKKYSVK